MTHHRGLLSVIFLLAFVVTGCVDSSGRAITASAQSCMTCHNGSVDNNSGGPGLENPHPYTGASNLLCTTCHG